MKQKDVRKTKSIQTFKAMAQNINQLAQTVKDKKLQDEFKTQMEPFVKLFGRYSQEQKSKTTLDWNKLHSPDPEQVIDYGTLSNVNPKQVNELMSQLVVLKLNGLFLNYFLTKQRRTWNHDGMHWT
jgi:UDP-N-acetylglucosamine pyrophosphorylase